MLIELRVSDLGIIEDIDWKLDAGLNVITGETGAGKSLIIDAVELLLTGSAGEDVIRFGSSRAFIEGVFLLSSLPNSNVLKTLLTEGNLIAEDETLIINCEVRKGRPTTAKINGRTITKGLLRQIGQLLIDIHGQSEHLSLLDKKQHLEFLDAYCGCTPQRKLFAAKEAQLRQVEIEISQLENQQLQNARQEEFLKFQIAEIQKSGLKTGEDEELENERRLISISAKLKENALKICQAISQGESYSDANPVLNRLNATLDDLRKLVDLDQSLKPHLDTLEKAIFGLEELARDLNSYAGSLEFNPDRLEMIEGRLETIRNLKRKYGKTIEDVLNSLDQAESELAGVGLSGERKVHLEEERASIRRKMGQMAAELSRARTEGAKTLSLTVREELADLEMEHMLFEAQVSQVRSENGLTIQDGLAYAFNRDGVDNIEFMVSTNPGEPLKPLAKIASTGEISRFTLALKSVLSETDIVPVLIFDEIDIGVGGRSGDIIGKKLWALSRNHQVICVTHLPQIAVYADDHFYVHKETRGDRTTSILECLDEGMVIDELAVMLGGKKHGETARLNARELIENASNWKQEFLKHKYSDN